MFLGIWGIVHGNDDGWTSAGVLGPLVLAALLLPAYVVLGPRPRRTPCCRCGCSPAVAFSVANVIGLFFTLGMFGTVFLLSQYLQIVQGYSPLEAGLRTLPWTAAPMVVAPIAGAARAPDRASRAAARRPGPADGVAGLVRGPHRVGSGYSSFVAAAARWPASAWA